METQASGLSQEKQDGSAQNFFLYLVTFLSLTFVAFGEGAILFGFIDKFVTDTELRAFPSFNQDSVKFGIAALLIAGPIFFIVSRIITRRINNRYIALESIVRKWLTYIVLFFAAATIIGDLITLVVNFLGGDFPSSFLLKVLVVLLIAGGIFSFYFWDMRRTETSSEINKISVLVAVVVVGITFISGFFIIDSPTVSRQKNIDQQIVSNLQAIDNSIQSYYGESGKLPQKLADLQQTKFSLEFQNIKTVSYEIIGAESYKLCADFMRSSVSDVKRMDVPYGNEWKHQAGNYCFERVVLKKGDNPVPGVK